MATQTQKKMTKRRLGSSVRKTTTKWKRSQQATVTPATGVGVSTLSEMVKLRNPGLRALNDIYILQEEPVDFEVDKASGLTKTVVDSIKSGLIVIPEVAEFYAKKYPCVGKVITHGDKTRYNIEPGTRVLFARLGGLREQIDGKDYVFIREIDLHAVLD